MSADLSVDGIVQRELSESKIFMPRTRAVLFAQPPNFVKISRCRVFFDPSVRKAGDENKELLRCVDSDWTE